MKVAVLKFFDLGFGPFYRYLVRKLLMSWPQEVNRLFIIGGGKSKLMFEHGFERKNGDVVAYTNFTPCENVDLAVDIWLASDPIIFYRKNAGKTLEHLAFLSPKIVVIPTRAIFTICGLVVMFRYRFVLVRYYGEKIWKCEDNGQSAPISFNCQVKSFDTVAFEFGIPLANDLGAEQTFFAGVDLKYGAEEDATPFRKQWRENIAASVAKVQSKGMTTSKLKAFPGCENSVLDIVASR